MIFVDTNVLIDVLEDDPKWMTWSRGQRDRLSTMKRLVIDAIVYAELAPPFAGVADLDAILARLEIDVLPLSNHAAFLAGKAHQAYRRANGSRFRPLSDFLSARTRSRSEFRY